MGFGLRTGACKVPSKRALRACGAAAVSLAAAAATRFSGTAFGLRPALAKSRRSGHAGLVGTAVPLAAAGTPALWGS